MTSNKVMLLGDTHGNLGFTQAAVYKAHGMLIDTIYQLGDFGIWDHTPGGQAFLNMLEITLAERDMKIIFADGNHENFDSLYEYPIMDDGFRRVRKHIIHAPRGHIWEHNATLFMAMGGAHSIDGPGGIWQQARGPGNGWWPQETITDEELATALNNLEKRSGGPDRRIDVVIAHDVPDRVTIPGISGYPAAHVVRQKLSTVADAARPRLWAAGHYHRYHSTVIGVGAEREDDCQVAILTGETQMDMSYLLIKTDPFEILPATKHKKFGLYNWV